MSEFQEIHIQENNTRVSEAVDLRASRFLVLNPEGCRQHSTETAITMMRILGANYGTHNLSNNSSKLADQISEGVVQPFLCARKSDRQPIACAALIKLNDTDVELGRGACIPGENGGAGLPILLAFQAWDNKIAFPECQILRGEIRTAKPTKEVPGGQATQSLCFETLGLSPTAIGPFFHHGVPDRQEMFFLANKTRQKPILGQVFLPEESFGNSTKGLADFFWQNCGGIITCFDRKNTNIAGTLDGLIITNNGSFLCVSSPERNIPPTPENKLIETIGTLDKQGFRVALARFQLTPLPQVIQAKNVDFSLDDKSKSNVSALLSLGFKFIGFEPVIKNGVFCVDLLLLKLSDLGVSRLVAPSFIESFGHNIENHLLANFVDWRQDRGGGGY